MRTRQSGQLGVQRRRGVEARVAPGISMSSSATSGRGGARGVEHLVAAPDLRDDLDVGLEREQAGDRLADHRLVLGEEDADHAGDRAR